MRISDWSSNVCSSDPTRDGNKKHLSGKVSASTFGAKLTLEGPLKKLKEDGKGSSSFLLRSEEHTSELQSLMRISYAVFCLKKKIQKIITQNDTKITVTAHNISDQTQ